MAFGLGVLRLSPTDFWQMTTRELNAAYEGIYGRAASSLTRNSLEGLMAMFPDMAQETEVIHAD